MTYRQGNSFFYYLVLLIGMGLIGSYFLNIGWSVWTVFSLPITTQLLYFSLYGSGGMLVLATFALAFQHSRTRRTLFTMVSGATGGVHAYILLVLFTEGIAGIILFAWIAAGLLLAFSAFAWIREL